MNGLDINDDGTHGPEHMSNDEIREHVTEHIDLSDEWTNYGDVNPELHGGRFIRYDMSAEEFCIIETRLWSDMIPDGRDDQVRINVYVYELADVFVDGDPAKGYTDVMVDILDSLGETHHDVTNPDVLERMQYYVADLPFYTGPDVIAGRTVDRENYWTELAEFGITDPQD